MYSVEDSAALSAALNDFQLSELHAVCRDRLARLQDTAPGHQPQFVRPQDTRADQVSFLLLAYACCLNHARWFAEHEAQLLRRRVEALSCSERLDLLALLEVHVQPRNEAGLYAVDFEHVPRLVAARKVLLHHGAALIHDDQLLEVAKHAHEVRLAAFVAACKRHLEHITRTNTEYHAPQFATILSTLADVQRWVCPDPPRASGRLKCTAQTLPALIASYAPLCVARLAIRLRERGHLVDKERVTLRMFLRAAHVDRGVAGEYWAGHVEEKQKDGARAALALVYEKNYACVGCGKIRASGLCPFEDSRKSLLSWCADTVPSAVRDIEDILARTSCASERCARVFALRHAPAGAELAAPRNPASYFTRAVGLDGV